MDPEAEEPLRGVRHRADISREGKAVLDEFVGVWTGGVPQVARSETAAAARDALTRRTDRQIFIRRTFPRRTRAGRAVEGLQEAGLKRENVIWYALCMQHETTLSMVYKKHLVRNIVGIFENLRNNP